MKKENKFALIGGLIIFVLFFIYSSIKYITNYPQGTEQFLSWGLVTLIKSSIYGFLIWLLIKTFFPKKKKTPEKFNWNLIIKLAFIGLFIVVPVFLGSNLLEHLLCDDKACIRQILFFPFHPWVEHLDGDAGFILIFLIPAYGIIAGAIIGFIIASLTKRYEKKKSIFKKSGFYLMVLIFIWLMISLIQPVKTSSDSFTKPFFSKNICKIQGCEYKEFEFCSNADIGYPEIPINQLPGETLYICETYQKSEVTRKDLVNGTDCVWTNNRGETLYYTPYMHSVYGGYSVKENTIYYEYTPPGKILCGEVGKIRYQSRCKC